MVSSRCFVVELLTLCEEARGFIPVFCSGANLFSFLCCVYVLSAFALSLDCLFLIGSLVFL